MGPYELVDGGCADGIDQVDGELDEEDGQKEGWHCDSMFAGLDK
jgi:hypothetical protein